MPKTRYLTAHEAADALGVNMQTLYAYVSRGLIRSEATGDSKRQRRYYAEDVDKLLTRKEARRNPDSITESALHWGTPLMDSAITLISDGKFFYRGQNVESLAQNHSIEQVASLIWTGDMEHAENLFDQNAPVSAHRYELMLLHIEVDGADLTPVQIFQVFLPIAAADDLLAYDLRPLAVTQSGARILRLMASVAAGEVPENIGIANMLQTGWCPHIPPAARLFNAAMILCADHELNASSFAARVAASVQSTPYNVVIAGLSALQGAKHGGYTERVEAFLNEVGTAEQARAAIAGRLRRGETIPGFGHVLYPDGDPRAHVLLCLIAETFPSSPAVALADSVIQAAGELLNDKPTIDFALATLARALNLEAGSALALFALGRTIGWIGHAIEQYADNRQIRPRARYIGEQPPA